MSLNTLRPLLDADALSQPREKPPLAGFWPRAAAFLIDGFILWFAANALVNAAHEALYPGRRFWQFVVIFCVFLYFWIGSSRLTRGRTLGKMLMNLCTMNRNGGYLDMADALRRGLLLSLPVFCAVTASEMTPLIGGLRLWLPDGGFPFEMGKILAATLATAFVLADCIVLAQHPHKRALHDQAAASIVVREGHETTALAIASQWDEMDAQQARTARWAALITTAVLLGFVVWKMAAVLPLKKKNFDEIAAANAKLAQPGIRVAYSIGPSSERAQRIRQYREDRKKSASQAAATRNTEEGYAPSAAPATEDAVTTGPMRSVDGHEFVFLFDCSEIMSSATLIASPAYREIERRLPEAGAALAREIYTDKNGRPEPFDRIIVIYTTNLPFYLSGYQRHFHQDVIETDDQPTTSGKAAAP